MATCFRTLRDDDVDTGSLVPFGMLRASGKRTDQLALFFAAVDEELRRRAERIRVKRSIQAFALTSLDRSRTPLGLNASSCKKKLLEDQRARF